MNTALAHLGGVPVQPPALSPLAAVKSWRADLVVPETTVWLPIADQRSLDQVSVEYAVKLLGANAPRRRRSALAGIIRDGTLSARSRCPAMAGLIFRPGRTSIPSVAESPVAEIDLSGFAPNPANAPRTLDYYRRLYGAPSEDTIGAIEVSETDVPAGPALRFRRRWIQPPDHRGRSILREHVVYAVCPAQIPGSLVLTVTWVDLTQSPALVQAADATARTLTLK
jgi:hypothetical protein